MTVINLDLTIDALIKAYLNMSDSAIDIVEYLRERLVASFYGEHTTVDEQLAIINALVSGCELKSLYDNRREAPSFIVHPAVFELLMTIAVDTENIAMGEDIVNLMPATFSESVEIITRMLNSIVDSNSEQYAKLKIRVLSNALLHVVTNNKIKLNQTMTGKTTMDVGYLESL